MDVSIIEVHLMMFLKWKSFFRLWRNADRSTKIKHNWKKIYLIPKFAAKKTIPQQNLNLILTFKSHFSYKSFFLVFTSHFVNNLNSYHKMLKSLWCLWARPIR